jgi:hypothetical protein
VSWEQGYDAGNTGLLKAVETAKLIGAVQERERIIKLLEVWWETDQELEELIALIKGENE